MRIATPSASLAYDPHGRLYQVSGGSAGTVTFLYDGDALVAEYGATGTVLRRYMHGTGVDEPVLWDEGSALNCSGTRFPRADRQGSVVAVSNCAGYRSAVQAYDAYGVPGNVAAAGPAGSGRFQYTGQAWLPELGLYYYKARMYSPMLGRFMQTDPIGYNDQINLYAYVGNDPVNGRDPTGKQTLPQVARAGCAAAPEACVLVAAGTALLAGVTVSTAVQNQMTVNGHVNSASSIAVPQSDPRARSQITESTTSSQNRRPESYVVRVQIQGTQVGGNNSTPLAGEMPISGGEVKGAVNELLGGLTSRQQRDALPAVTGAFRGVDRAIANGGLEAGFQIRGLNKDFSPNQVRVDIEILKGKNIQF